MPFLILGYYLLMAFALHYSRGHYAKSLIEKLFFGFLVLWPALLLWKKDWRIQFPLTRWLEFFLHFGLVFCAFYSQRHFPLSYGEDSPFGFVLKAILGSAYLLSWLLLFVFSTSLLPSLKLRPLQVAYRPTLFLLYYAAFAAMALVPWVSPRPFIDVFQHNTEAVDFFVSGLNPYTQSYPQLYDGRYGYLEAFVYPPGLLYWLLPFRLLFTDIRFAFIFANLLTCFGLWQIGKQLQVSKPLLRLIPLLWLFFPVTTFVLEQAWIDTTLITFTVLALWVVVSGPWRGKWVALAVLLGFLASYKQYGFFISGFILLWLLRKEGLKRTFQASALLMAVFSLITVPFVVADPDTFYRATVGTQLVAFFRPDAMNVTVYLVREWNLHLPALLGLLLAGSGALVCGTRLLFKKEVTLFDLTSAIFIAFTTAFLFGKWAFCNYYYLLAGFLVIVLLFSLPKESDSGAT